MAWAAVAALVASSGCEGARNMAKLSATFESTAAAIQKASGSSDVTATLWNGHEVAITIVSRSLCELPPETGRVKAKELARVAYQTVQGKVDFDSVGVAFVTEHRDVVVLGPGKRTAFEFTSVELEAADEPRAAKTQQ